MLNQEGDRVRRDLIELIRICGELFTRFGEVAEQLSVELEEKDNPAPSEPRSRDEFVSKLEEIAPIQKKGQSPASKKMKEKNKKPIQPGTAADQVWQMIKKSQSGVDAKEIEVRTSFNKKKVQNITFKLKKLGLIGKVGKLFVAVQYEA